MYYTLQQEVKEVSRKDLLVLIFKHKDFKDSNGNFIELHAVKRYWKVHQLGDPDFFFDHVAMDQEI